MEGSLERTGDGVLAGVVEAGEEQDEALLVPWRVALSEDLDDLVVAEPIRDGSTGPEALPELGTGDVESLDALGNLVDGLVLIGGGEVGHLLEWHHLDVELIVVLDDEVLSIVGAVEVDALRVLARASVVAADDEVGRTIVLADDGVPDGFTGTSHAHSKGEEGEVAKTVGVLLHDCLIDANTGVVVDVSGLGETDDGVDEDVGLALAGGADGELTVSTVHGVAGLEGDNLLPRELLEVGTKLSRGVLNIDVRNELMGKGEVDKHTSESNIVEVCRGLDGLHLATNIEFLHPIVKVGDSWMSDIVSSEDVDGLLDAIWFVDILD